MREDSLKVERVLPFITFLFAALLRRGGKVRGRGGEEVQQNFLVFSPQNPKSVKKSSEIVFFAKILFLCKYFSIIVPVKRDFLE